MDISREILQFLHYHPLSSRDEIANGTAFEGSGATLKRLIAAGVQDGDDGLFVHVRFLFVVTLYYMYDVFAEILRSGHSFHAVTFSESYSEPQSYRNHQGQEL